MKQCTKCKIDKEQSEFNIRKHSPDGLSYQCKECTRHNSAFHYLENKRSYVKRNKERRTGYRTFIDELKSKSSCEVCGNNHPAVLDFHHHDPNGKEFEISRGHHFSLETLQTEINKCKILCSNCHRVLHWNENNCPFV